MRPKKHETTEEEDLFRARLDQIIDMKQELVQLAGRLDWDWLDGEIAPLYGTETAIQQPTPSFTDAGGLLVATVRRSGGERRRGDGQK